MTITTMITTECRNTISQMLWGLWTQVGVERWSRPLVNLPEYTPLHLTAVMDWAAIAKLLISHGAFVALAVGTKQILFVASCESIHCSPRAQRRGQLDFLITQ